MEKNVRFYLLLGATQASKPAELLSVHADICTLLSRYGIFKTLISLLHCVQITRQLFKLSIVLLTVSESVVSSISRITRHAHSHFVHNVHVTVC